jgi:hypothetical protein
VSAAPCELRGDAARTVLRGLRLAGASIVVQRRSHHASDCGHEIRGMCERMGDCRCLRVARLRVPRAGDWLLLFGDCAEGPTVRLQGPYTAETPLTYGGGFWAKVEV